MPFDSEGIFDRKYNFEEDRVNDIDIVTDHMDGEFDNFAEGLSSAFLRDGRVAMFGDLDVGNFKVKNVAKGTLDTDAVNRKQLDDGLSLKENLSNKVKELSEDATDEQYPSAKAVYDKTAALTENSADINFSNLTAEARKTIINIIAPNHAEKSTVSKYPFTAEKSGWVFGGWNYMTSGKVFLNGTEIGVVTSDPDGTNASAFSAFMGESDVLTIEGNAPHFCTFIPCKGN